MAIKNDFEKIARILSKKNISEEQLQIVESLLPKIFSAYEAIGDVNEISYARLLNQHKEKRRMLETLKDLYDDEVDFAQSSKAIDIRLKKALQKKLLLNLERNDLTDQEVEHIKDTIKMLEKSIKSNEKFITGIQKGEAITDSLLQATLGISRSWAGEAGYGGIRGAIKGLGKGLKDNLTAANALATIMSFTVGQLIKLDQVRSELFMSKGYVGITDELAGMTADYSKLFGFEAPAAAQGVFESAKDNIRNQNILLEGFQSGTFLEMGLLQYQGVSMDAFTTIYRDLRMGIGKSDKEARQFGRQLRDFSKNIKRPPEEIFRETAANLPFLSRYGSEFDNVFVSLTVNAKDTNIALDKLVSLGDSLDSIEMSSRAAAKINALLGQRVMDVAEFTIAGAEKKAQMIGEGLKEYQSNFGKIPPRILRSISKEVGSVSEAELLQLAQTGGTMVTGLLDQFDPDKGVEGTIRELRDTLSQKVKLTTSLASMGQAFTEKIAKNKTLRYSKEE